MDSKQLIQELKASRLKAVCPLCKVPISLATVTILDEQSAQPPSPPTTGPTQASGRQGIDPEVKGK